MQSTPKSIKYRRDDRILELEWNGQSSTHYPAHLLRCECRCAGCVDEFTGVRTLDVDSVPKDIAVNAIKPVGNYALHFTFSDGHDTGLYTWEHLYRIAPAQRSA